MELLGRLDTQDSCSDEVFRGDSQAAEMLGLTDPQFYHWARNRSVERKVIGKTSLVRSTDVLTGIRARDHDATDRDCTP